MKICGRNPTARYLHLRAMDSGLNACPQKLRGRSEDYLASFQGRLLNGFEAKFLTGALAGILTDSPLVGYLADYPIFAERLHLIAEHLI